MVCSWLLRRGPAVQPPSVPEGIEAPGAGAGSGEIEEEKAEHDRRMALIENRPESLRSVTLEVGNGHLAGEEKGHWAGVEPDEEERATVCLEGPGPPGQAAIRGRSPSRHDRGGEAIELGSAELDKQKGGDDSQDAEKIRCPGAPPFGNGR